MLPAMAKMTLSSPSFAPNAEIPRRHTCEGENVSPALVWSGVPADARTLVLILDDPDAPDPKAPRTVFVHWVVYNLPAAVSGLPEGAEAAVLPPGARVGTNDWHRASYGGPCPPIGRHRYYFKLYALDIVLPDGSSANKAAVLEAMRGHVVAEAQLIGTYQKQK
jgi:Raf kinase inhibitor-like YbhB/YbcL family protein